MKKYFLLLIFMVYGSSLYFAQGNEQESLEGYNFKIIIRTKATENKIALKRLFGSLLLTVDSVQYSQNQAVFFKGSESLQSGIYFLCLNSDQKYEFLISSNQSQNFTIQIDTSEPVENRRFTGSTENTAFLEYESYLHQYQLENTNLNLQLNLGFQCADSIFRRKEKQKNRYIQYCQNLEKNFGGTTLAFLAKYNQFPTTINFSSEHNNILTTNDLTNNELCFDSIDFSDERLVTTPILLQKILFYFQNPESDQPDQTFTKIDTFVSKLKINSIIYQVSLEFLYNYFYHSALFSRSEIFNYIAEKYMVNFSSTWNDSDFIQKVQERLSKSKLNQPGIISTNLKLYSPEGKVLELKNIKAPYIVLLFYDPDCEACVTTTRYLISSYQKLIASKFEVFAVYIGENKNTWLSYIESHRLNWINVADLDGKQQIEKKYDINALPLIYLLDKDKKVIFRDIEINELVRFLEKE